MVDEKGIDVELLKEVKEGVGSVSPSTEHLLLERARFVRGQQVWEVPCDIAIPCATQRNEITW